MISVLLIINNAFCLFFEFSNLYNINFPPKYETNTLNLLYWFTISNIIIQVCLFFVNLLYILWNCITCCINNKNSLVEFGILKTILILYLISSSIYSFYLLFDNLSEVKKYESLFYLIASYFIWFIINIIILSLYRIFIYCKKNKEIDNEYILLEN